MKGKENSKALEIFKALENTDDELLEKCENYSGSKIKIKSKWFAAAAAAVCLCTVGAGIHLMNSRNDIKTSCSDSTENIVVSSAAAESKSEEAVESHSDIAEVGGEDTQKTAAQSKATDNQNANGTAYGTTSDGSEADYVSESTAEIYEVPRWDEMSLPEQFSEFERDGNNYFVNSNIIEDESRIGEKLGDVTLTGYDIYTDEEYSIDAEIFAVSKLSQNYMVAVKYEGYDDYYPCENSDYHPADFQQLMSDTNLREEMTFGEIYYSYFDDELNYYNVDYFVDNSEVFWTELFDKVGNPQAIDPEDVPEGFFSDYDFNCESKLIRGGIGISSDGYIITNIPSTGAAFYIGEDKVKAFADYIDKNFNKGVAVTPAEPFDDSGEDGDLTVQTSPAYDPNAIEE